MLSGLQSDPALFYFPSSSRPFLEQFICGGPTCLILSRRLTPSLRPKLQYLSLFLLKVQQCSPDMIQRKKAKQVLLKASVPPHLAIHACTLSPSIRDLYARLDRAHSAPATAFFFIYYFFISTSTFPSGMKHA